MVQLGETVRIGAEENIVAVEVGNVAAIGCRGKGGVGGIEEEREVDLIGVRDPRVVDGDRALKAVSA